MNIQEGYIYHIDDSFFEVINDKYLMSNKENNKYRPMYFCVKDIETNLLWIIPLSSQVDKYMKVYNQKVLKNNKCDTLVFGKFDRKDSVFLLQNMFPITEKYIHHIHTKNNNPITVSYAMQKELKSKFKKVIALIRKGHNIIFTNALDIEKIMLNELLYENKKEIEEDEYDMER